jgi:hypothetical protein
MRTIPADITWKRTGRRSWICTIRREPEVIYDLSDMTALSQYVPPMNQYAALGGPGFLTQQSLGTCPFCGQSRNLMGHQGPLGVFAGLFGGFGG